MLIIPCFLTNFFERFASNAISVRRYYVPLPKLAPDFGRITVMRGSSKDIDTDQIGIITKMMMIAEMRMTIDCCSTDHLIIDAKNTTLSNVLKINPLVSKKFMTAVQVRTESAKVRSLIVSILFQKGYSDGVLSIHIINMPAFGNSTYNFMKGLLKEKFQARVSC